MPPVLLLIDGHAVVYRAYYAVKGLTAPSGVPTNAVYGFVRMFRQLLPVLGTTHCVVVFDGGLPADRMALLPEYKAHRPAMPEDLRSQFALVEDYLDATGIVHIRRDGEEADDIIASLANMFQGSFGEIYIASSDKDLYQMVNETVKMVAVSGDNAIMDAESIKAKTGVVPSQVVDWLAMIGDSADNIRGVPGVGKVTAAGLLNQFGSFAGIMANSVQIKSQKIRNAIEFSRGDVERNRKLIELKRGIDCRVGPEDLLMKKPDYGRLLLFFKLLGFNSMAKEISEPVLL